MLYVIFILEPSAAPSITSVNVTSTSLELQWDELPVPERNGEILGYIIWFQRPINTTQNTSNIFILLMDLKPYTIYEYAIAAYTSVGPGPFGFYQEQTDEASK